MSRCKSSYSRSQDFLTLRAKHRRLRRRKAVALKLLAGVVVGPTLEALAASVLVDAVVVVEALVDSVVVEVVVLGDVVAGVVVEVLVDVEVVVSEVSIAVALAVWSVEVSMGMEEDVVVVVVVGSSALVEVIEVADIAGGLTKRVRQSCKVELRRFQRHSWTCRFNGAWEVDFEQHKHRETHLLDGNAQQRRGHQGKIFQFRASHRRQVN